MGIYIGVIEKKGYEPTIFFNFKPLAEVRNNEIAILSVAERSALLPKSEKLDINFSYKFNSVDQRNEMEDSFEDQSLTVFEFTLADLRDNIRNGVRNQTGYYVDALAMLDAGKIRGLNSVAVYPVISENDVLSDFFHDPIVEIDVAYASIGDEIFVDIGSFYAGPYVVDFREITQTYYIRPQIKNSKYTINGYNKAKSPTLVLSDVDGHWSADGERWVVLHAREGMPVDQLDVIDDAQLLESFRESIGVENIVDGRIIIDDIERLLDQYENSLLSGAGISDSIRKKRLNRLVELLTSEEELTDTLSYITESICSLLIRYRNTAEVDEWVQSTLAMHPEFWDKIRDTRVIGTRIDQLNQDVEELQQQRDSLDAEIKSKREKAVSIDLQAIEEKKKEMLAVDTEYAETKKRLNDLLVTLGMVEDLSALQRRLNTLRDDVTYTETHKRHLENDARYLEMHFSQLINNQHEKMLGIAFDGFMASKMLKAAAEWEAEQANRLSEHFVRTANSVPVQSKTPEELVDYLTRTIQIVRPQYSRNTIINIAICTTQGFLTVFSGEPGCGKTSICNIFADVLGLNKIEEMVESDGSGFSAARYVPVSVERGWTSKRDFVGYFNPLSKTFDKSNRDVYDALSRLHMEHNKGLNAFPFIILLDEANLSPMEYYWADFMYICDDTGRKRQINLGDDNVLSIPDTLRFVATINNDHTTETLSPRLIDRAWIVQLPQQVGPVSTCAEISKDQIDIISWESLTGAFNNQGECIVLPSDIQKRYDAVVNHLREVKLYISPRVEIAIKRYWASASCWFEKELGIEPTVVALDYAIAQKVLPKIQGQGNDYEKWLEKLRAILNTNDLNMSAKIVKDITERGIQQMKYFQFFA